MKMKISSVVTTLFYILVCYGCAPAYFKKDRAERLYRTGQQFVSEGKTTEAVDKFRQSLALSTEINYQPGIAHNYNELAILYTAKGRCQEARSFLLKAKTIYLQLEMKEEVSKSMNNIVQTFIKEKDYQAAVAQYEELLEWDATIGNQMGMCITRYNIGHVYENYLLNHEKAKENYVLALDLYEKIDNPKGAPQLKQLLNKAVNENR